MHTHEVAMHCYDALGTPTTPCITRGLDPACSLQRCRTGVRTAPSSADTSTP